MNEFLNMEQVWPWMEYNNVLGAVDNFQEWLEDGLLIPARYKLTTTEYRRVEFVLDGV